jgi:hypothetical protein
VDFVLRGVEVQDVAYLGRPSVRLTTTSPGESLAVLHDTTFRDGTIDADIAVKVMAPPGVRMPGFAGLAVRIGADTTHDELFSIRPGNARADDQAMRNHSIQYGAAPDFGWYELRTEWPWVYEAYSDMDPDGWTHMKIEVAGRSARVYLNRAAMPSLIVDGLKGTELQGGVGLWGFPTEEACFSDLRVAATTPRPIKNGGEIAGAWTSTLATGRGQLSGTLRISRMGQTLAGSWSGAPGEESPVSGTWRDGYVELSFAGRFPSGPTTFEAARIALAGWVDNSAVSGRVRIAGRADGTWTATKKA